MESSFMSNVISLDDERNKYRDTVFAWFIEFEKMVYVKPWPDLDYLENLIKVCPDKQHPKFHKANGLLVGMKVSMVKKGILNKDDLSEEELKFSKDIE